MTRLPSAPRHGAPLAVALAALLLAAHVAPADAQFGGLGRRIKERVEKAVDDRTGAVGDSSVRAATRPGVPRFDANVLELTPDVIGRALKADDVERAHAQRRAQVLARIDAASHPVARPAATGPSFDDQASAYVACFQKYMGADADVIKRHCGDMQAVVEKEKAKEKARQAAERARNDSLKGDSTVDIPADSAGAAAAGFTRQQYGIVKERIGAWLANPNPPSVGAALNPCIDNTPSAYTFTDDERAALSARHDELAARFTVPHHMRTGRKGCKPT